jgi:predicted ATP-grasp superfamily ATP-dependent carboligase
MKNQTVTQQPVGAVVIGGDFHGLGIVRSLGRRGIPVCVIDDEYSIGRFSRYTTFAETAPSIRREAETVDFLLEIAKRRNLKGWVLFPTRDEIVAAVARHRSALTEWYRVPTPEWDCIKWAWNKWNTYCLAEKIRIPIPRTWAPRSVEELDEIPAEFPLGIKPAVKEDFFYATKAKAWRANNRDELRALFEKASRHVAGNEVLVQEIIPGGGSNQFSSCVFVKDGLAIGRMAAKRWRQHPPEFGRAATFVETVDCPQLEEPTLRFLRAIGYYGLAEVEYKLDPRDGQYKLLDVNARTWGFHCLGPSAGVDFSYLLFADQLGQRVETCSGQPGVGWIRMVTDIPTSFREIISGRLALSNYLDTLKNFRIESVFSRDDVMPTFLEIALIPYLMAKRGY